MPPPLNELLLLDDRPTPGGAAWNMAMDEALLNSGIGAILRVYRWRLPAFSFGYFLSLEEAATAAGPAREVVRRWTGGGMVPHGDDFTWSLILPSGEPLGKLRPVESYAAIHGLLALALRQAGLSVDQVDSHHQAPAGGLCFVAPAPGDLLVNGRKIAGAGQRRCRHGLLHQGSISGVDLPDDFPGRLASAFARTVRPYPPAALPLAEAARLEQERYGSPAWLQKR